MNIPSDLQKSIVEVLQEENTIVFVMSHTGQYLSLLGGSNRALYADGSVLIGKSYPEVLNKEKAEYFQSLLDKVIRTRQPVEVEYELSAADFIEKLSSGPSTLQKFRGNLFPLEIDPDEKLHKVVWAIHNITEEK
ncbi:PAS domain-containing protein [Oceanispirochaeta sp.]|uniref:PAS domain-containing protein n=1 Tax=Oceanispirochaeta sp. TaxID=2035350 RepID=UPI0026373C1E|nr:PAS domain-containing protein [Oceanispirochaeta sp.]MDA3956980.1 PAS domain-containing protein [Oceanispirochaeta sp.]